MFLITNVCRYIEIFVFINLAATTQNPSFLQNFWTIPLIDGSILLDNRSADTEATQGPFRYSCDCTARRRLGLHLLAVETLSTTEEVFQNVFPHFMQMSEFTICFAFH